MSVGVLDGQSPFRITLASPAEVDGSGTVIVTAENLTATAGEFTSIDVSGDVTAGGDLAVTGTSTLTGAVTTGAALTVGTNITAAGGTTALRALTVSQTAAVTGAVTMSATLGVTGITTASGGLIASGSTTSLASDLVAAGNVLSVDNLGNKLSLTLPTYANNADALLGGLVVGNVYQTAAGVLLIVV